jgi:pimeloyl-ACP methyl ester carboxylesterase
MYTYFTKEEKGDTALLFLHGWGCDGAIWNSVAASVSGYTLFQLDFWGFGASEMPPDDGWNVAEYANAVKNFCDEQKLSSVNIVCHSFGARVAIMLCHLYPNLVSSLVITGGAGLRRFSLKRTLKVAQFKLCRLFVKLKLCKPDILAKFGSSDYQHLSTLALKNTFNKVIKLDLTRQLKSVICPTLLVWGRKDTDTPLWMAKKFKRKIKNSSLVLIDGDHFAFLQHSAQFSRIVAAFLGGVDANN